MIRAYSYLIASLSVFYAIPTYCQDKNTESTTASKPSGGLGNLDEDDPPPATNPAENSSRDAADQAKAQASAAGSLVAAGVQAAAAEAQTATAGTQAVPPTAQAILFPLIG